MASHQPLAWKRMPYTNKSRPDDRSRILAVVNNMILHLHPSSVPAQAVRFTYTWGLGGISTLLVVFLVLTGLLLMFRYDARVDYAYTSIQELETEVAFGSLFRAVHHWSANLLVITSFLHLLRVFFTGSFKQGRTMNWMIGLALLVLALAANFTGYLLPWDQLAYWAVTVSTNLLAYIPIIGTGFSNFLLAGPEVGQGALSNFYALHVAVIPLLIAAAMSYHFWKIRKNGGISQPLRPENERAERLTTIPHLISRELAVAAAVLTSVVLFSMLVPAPLGQIANPLNSPNPAKAAWYFAGLQELLLHMHPLAAITLVGLLLLGLVFLPRWDCEESDIGTYFRSVRGRRAALLGALLGLDLTPILVIIDEYWLDFTKLLPGLPATVSNGLIPLVLSVFSLVGLYAAMRLVVSYQGRRANHSEGLLGVFTFLMVSFVVLTVIGVFFRGPNMRLVLPF